MQSTKVWGSQKKTIFVLTCMVLLSAGASAGAHRSALPTGLRLGTGWFFHVAFGVFIFVVLYVLVALLTVTLLAGGPPTKMSGLGFSLDWDKALEIANAGAESLEELNERMSEAITGFRENLAEIERLHEEMTQA